MAAQERPGSPSLGKYDHVQDVLQRKPKELSAVVLKRVFNVLDQDRDGFVSAEDLLREAERLSVPLQPDHMHAMVSAAAARTFSLPLTVTGGSPRDLPTAVTAHSRDDGGESRPTSRRGPLAERNTINWDDFAFVFNAKSEVAVPNDAQRVNAFREQWITLIRAIQAEQTNNLDPPLFAGPSTPLMTSPPRTQSERDDESGLFSPARSASRGGGDAQFWRPGSQQSRGSSPGRRKHQQQQQRRGQQQDASGMPDASTYQQPMYTRSPIRRHRPSKDARPYSRTVDGNLPAEDSLRVRDVHTREQTVNRDVVGGAAMGDANSPPLPGDEEAREALAGQESSPAVPTFGFKAKDAYETLAAEVERASQASRQSLAEYRRKHNIEPTTSRPPAALTTRQANAQIAEMVLRERRAHRPPARARAEGGFDGSAGFAPLEPGTAPAAVLRQGLTGRTDATDGTQRVPRIRMRRERWEPTKPMTILLGPATLADRAWQERLERARFSVEYNADRPEGGDPLNERHASREPEEEKMGPCHFGELHKSQACQVERVRVALDQANFFGKSAAGDHLPTTKDLPYKHSFRDFDRALPNFKVLQRPRMGRSSADLTEYLNATDPALLGVPFDVINKEGGWKYSRFQDKYRCCDSATLRDGWSGFL